MQGTESSTFPSVVGNPQLGMQKYSCRCLVGRILRLEACQYAGSTAFIFFFKSSISGPTHFKPGWFKSRLSLL